MKRTANVSRKTKETDITLFLCLDGGEAVVDTGIGFFDHMLTALAFHAGWGLVLTVRGDLQVDGHHTAEDTGLALGQALREAMSDRIGIARFGQALLPMDEALAQVALDVSGRPYLIFDAPMPQDRIGVYDACLTQEFWRAFTQTAGVTLHIHATGANAHHVTEALFKGCARALGQALAVVSTTLPSTKGVL